MDGWHQGSSNVPMNIVNRRFEVIRSSIAHTQSTTSKLFHLMQYTREQPILILECQDIYSLHYRSCNIVTVGRRMHEQIINKPSTKHGGATPRRVERNGHLTENKSRLHRLHRLHKSRLQLKSDELRSSVQD